MLEKTKGIVLKTHRYSETSIICRVFTRELGLLSFMVPGVRAARKGKGNVLQPGQVLDLDCYYHENKNLLRFREYKVDFIPEHLHRDIRKFSVLTFLIDLLGQLVGEKEQNIPLFDHSYAAIREIDTTEINGMYPLSQMLEISRIMGFFPNLDLATTSRYFNLEEGTFQDGIDMEPHLLPEETSGWMHRLILGESGFTRAQRRQLLEIMIDYFRLHVPGMKGLKSHEVLHDLLS